MTRELLDKAKNLDKEIQKYQIVLEKIKSSVFTKEKEDEKARKELNGRGGEKARWILSRFGSITFTGRKVIVTPHYEFGRGIEVDADAELMEVIINYFEKKKKECEIEFEQIGGAGE